MGDPRSIRWKSGPVFTVITVVSFIILYLFWRTSPTSTTETVSTIVSEEASINKTYDVWRSENVVTGKPTAKFRDNLKSGVKYMTTWSESSGYTNDVMAFINLIYLSMEADRTPIIPPFSPSHHFENKPLDIIPFSEVFDLARLAKHLKRPLPEWQDFKVLPSNESNVETLGCWSLATGLTVSDKPREAIRIYKHLGLDISYTPVPTQVRLASTDNTNFASYWGLIALAFPSLHSTSIKTPLKSPIKEVTLEPDQEMVCFDYLYYTASFKPFELTKVVDYSPAWNFVGKHLHFTPRLEDIADQYLRRTLKVEIGQPTPAYIAAHIRRTDFKDQCQIKDDPDCFAPMHVIGRRVQEVRNELSQIRGMNDVPVIMMSDEEDPAWWKEVRQMGYWIIDHNETVANYGVWYPILIDSVIQSGGVGLVGTEGSTMSLIAKARCEQWNGGTSKIISWGKKGADDH